MEALFPDRRPAVRAALPGLLLAAAVLAPFAGKAFTIDDTLFLRQAAHALEDPLHPSAVVMSWSQDLRPVRLSEAMPNGPLGAWLLVPAVAAGAGEAACHAATLVLLAAALVATSALSLAMGASRGEARLAALLLASSPAVLALAGTVMPDVAAMAFGVIAVERALAVARGAGPSAALAAAASLAAATLGRSHLVLLAPVVLFALPAATTSTSRRRLAAAAVGGPVLAALVLLATKDPATPSGNLLHATGVLSSLQPARSNLLAFALHQAWLFPLGAAWAASRGLAALADPRPWAGAMAAAVLFAAGGEASWLVLAPVAGLGLGAFLAAVGQGARARGEWTRRLLAAWLAIPLVLLVYVHLPAKYLLASAPAAAVLSAAWLVRGEGRRRLVAAAVIVVAGTAFGIALLRADAAFANLGRRAVDELVRPRIDAGDTVWFHANWGFQWYAENAGARILTVTPPFPEPGDYVVSARVTISGVPIAWIRGREWVAATSDTAPGGRLVSPSHGAGFWSNGWGYLPWAWSKEPVDRFDLWRIR